MKKQAYQKPAMQVVILQQQHQLLAGSITEVNSIGLGDGDLIGIIEDPNSNWGR